MTENTQIKIFEEKQVRTLWDKEKEEWYFSVIDVVAVFTDSDRPRKYWNETSAGRKRVVRKNRTTENACIRWKNV